MADWADRIAEARKAYPERHYDADVEWFYAAFDEEPGSKILEMGANEEFASNVLTDLGHRVWGVDLRQYQAPTSGEPPCNYEFIRGDVNTLPDDFWREHMGTFDAVFSLSAVEHFGLRAYREDGQPAPYGDVLSTHTAWRLLREGGTYYVTVPYSAKHVEKPPHWRIYNRESTKGRLIQDFEVVGRAYFGSGAPPSGGEVKWEWEIGDEIAEAVADAYEPGPPHLTIGLKLRKVPVARVAPDWR